MRLGLLTLAWTSFTGALDAAPVDHFDVSHPAIIVADSQSTVYLFNPRTQERAIVAQGVTLDRPYDVVRDHKGNIVASDTGTLRIVLINPFTGEQTVLAEGPALGVPYGITIDRHNSIYIANSVAILRIDPETRLLEVFAEGGLLQVPLDVAVAPNGNVYVADGVAGVIRIDRVTKTQTYIANEEFMRKPVGIAIDGDRKLYVADAGARCIVAIDLEDYSQRVVSREGFLTTPVAIVPGPAGTILVSDPDAFEMDGGILSIGDDGTQTPVMRGFGDLVNARGIAIVAGSKGSEKP